MSVLTAVQQACSTMGLTVPLAVYGSTDREQIELQDVANEVNEGIVRAYDWQVLKKIGTITGDGATQDYTITTFAPDYHRMTQKSTLWVTSRPFYPLEHITDTDLWLGIVTSGLTTTLGQWTIYGGQFHIMPALAAADTAKFYYMSSYSVMPASGTNKARFTLDTDTFLLNERLLRLGIIWQWKANKGLPYAEDLANFEIAMQSEISRDKGSKILIVGTQRSSMFGSEAAWPGTLGT
jgi:hypothetical protein